MKARSRLSERVSKGGVIGELLDAAPAILLYVDGGGTVQAAGAGFKELFDLPPEEMISRRLDELVEPLSRCFTEFMSYSEVFAQPFQDAAGTYTRDVELMRPKHRFLQVSSAPVSVDGKPDGRIWLLRDITKEREIMELKIEYGGVRSADELKSKFMTIISHQLRTPLNSIRWNAELLLAETGSGLSGDGREAVEQMYASVVNSLAIIDDMLLAVDIERRAVHLDKSPTDIGQVVRKVVGDHAKTAEMRGIRLVVKDLPEAPPRLFIDRAKIELALGRVVGNAIAYSPPGREVEIGLRSGKKDVTVEVLDRGVGIPESERARVFEKFYRSKDALKLNPNASGLGLYITKYIVEAHDGRIDFMSEEGRGTKFMIMLPRDHAL